MDQAKKYGENDVLLSISQSDKRALERRYGLDYKSAASSAVSRSDVSSLEHFINSIEQEEFPKDSFLDSVLFYADFFLKQFGYASSLVESRSHKKLKRQQQDLQNLLSSTNEQIVFLEGNISTLDNYIHSSLVSLDEYQQQLSTQKNDLSQFRKEIADYRDVTRNSLQPKETMYLKQAELDVELKEQQVQDLQETCDTSFLTIQEYYSRKSQDISEKSLFEGNRILITSLLDTIALDMKRSKQEPATKVIAKNRVGITNSYKIQDELLQQKAKRVNLYNQTIQNMPSYKSLATSVVEKRRSLPSTKR